MTHIQDIISGSTSINEIPKDHTAAKVVPLLLLGLFSVIALMMQPEAAYAKGVRNPVKVIGKSDDGKYPIYDLQGDLNDLNYQTSGNIVYQPDDLPDRMVFLSPKDATGGAYKCEFICKDAKGRVVGLNPSWAKLYHKPVPN